jgi:MFS family permease
MSRPVFRCGSVASVKIRRPAFILALLTGLNFLNYLDRTVLAAVLPRVQTDLHLDDLQAGTLATAFLIGYFATSPIFGALADRASSSTDSEPSSFRFLSRTSLMAFGVLVWSLATWMSGRTHGFHTMLAVRALVGVGEASYASVAPAIIDDMAAAGEKGKKLAVFYLAIPVGSAFGYLLGGFIEKHLGWRAAFSTVGIPGAILALSCLLIAEPPPLVARMREPLLRMLAPLLRERLYVRAVLGYCAFTFALGGFSYWAPKYIHERYGTELDHANYVFGLLLVVAGAIGTGIGGVWGDRSARKALGRAPLDESAASRAAAARGQLWVCGVASLLGAPFAVLCLLSPSVTGFFAAIFVCEIALFLSTSPINAALLQSVPGHVRASAMAISIFAIHLLGDLWSPPLVGGLTKLVRMQTAMLVLPAAILASGLIWLTRRQSGISPTGDVGNKAT